MQDHGVDKLFWLEHGALSQAQKNIVYVCRPEIGLMRIIAGASSLCFPAAPCLPSSFFVCLVSSPRIPSCPKETRTILARHS